MSKPPIQPQDKYVLRLPDGMRDRLKAAAEFNGRSMNAEIVQRLEDSFNNWPQISWSPSDRAHIRALPSRLIINLEKEIQGLAAQSYRRMVRNNIRAANEMKEAFEHLIADVHEDDRPRIEEEFDGLLLALGVDLRDDDDL